MIKRIGELILGGALQGQERSNLASPWVKFALIVLPLLFGSLQIYIRFAGDQMTRAFIVALVTLFLGFASAQSIDLRTQNRARMARWGLSCCLFEIVCLLLAFGYIDGAAIKNGLSTIQPITFIGNFITFRDCLMFGFFVLAARGMLLITATDAFTLCVLLTWSKNLRALYETAVTTYFTIRHALGKSFAQASMVAKNRFNLMRSQQSWSVSFESAADIYVRTLLSSLADKAELTESILNERRWYSRDVRNPVNGWNSEDTIAVVILALFGGLAILGWKCSGS